MSAHIYIDSSPIHGTGVFAARSFKKGDVVGRYASRRTKLKADDNPFVIEVYDEDEVLVEHRIGTNEFRYINHSTTPNVQMHDHTLQFVALKDIAEDEELTWFYGEEFEAEI
jgi:SET domain-containing protein